MNVAILGAGNVGVALADLLQRSANLKVSLGSRDPEQTQSKLKQLEITYDTNIVTYQQAVNDADLVIFCVPDTLIAEFAHTISPTLNSETILAHCSGALDSHILPSSHRRCSLHPLNSFPSISAAFACFANADHSTSLVCEGDALDQVTPLFADAGFAISHINRESKPLYHAASVIVCNYLTALMDAGLESAELAGLDKQEFWRAVQPLINTTLSNISTEGTVKALSGPIDRGDAKTIANHLDAFSQHAPELGTLYRELGQRALKIAKQKHGESDKLEQIRNTLKS